MTGPAATVFDSDQVGTVKGFSGTAIPTNWLLAAGQNLLRSDYPELFAVISTRYGAADGTHFNIPDLSRKFIYGATSADLAAALATGGEVNHTLTVPEMPQHAHAVEAYGTYSGTFGKGIYTDYAGGGSQTAVIGTPPTGSILAGGSPYTAINVGGGGSHNNLPPYVIMAWIIKVTGTKVGADGSLVPVGSPLPWLVATIPVGYREFDGSAIVQGTHPKLYALFGAVIPDLRGRFMMGVSGTHPIGEALGEEGVTLTAAQSGIRAHAHGVTQTAHNHAATNLPVVGTSGSAQVGAGTAFAGLNEWRNDPVQAAHANITIDNATAAAATSAHNNLPPYRTVRWITLAA